MSPVFEEIDDKLAEWIAKQPLFFVGTAPSGDDGHVNVSPKGLDTLVILDPTTVAYLDLTGSGIETVAHLRENGRVCVMLCAFEGAPRILRLQGRGEVVEPSDPDFDDLVGRFPPYPGRAVGDPGPLRPHRRHLRLRRAADGLQRRAAGPARLGRAQGSRRARRVPGQEERSLDRRPPGPGSG